MEFIFILLPNIGAIVALGFGLICAVRPRIVARVSYLTPENSRGISELRVIGGFFAGMAAWAMLTQAPVAFQVVGAAWGTAAFVRLICIFVDKVPLRGGSLSLFVLEVGLSLFLFL